MRILSYLMKVQFVAPIKPECALENLLRAEFTLNKYVNPLKLIYHNSAMLNNFNWLILCDLSTHSNFLTHNAG